MDDARFAARQHGKASTYSRGCRCAACKADATRRARERRKSRAGRVVLVKFEHGDSGYKNWGCRCEACSSANRATCKEYQANNQAVLNARQRDRRREDPETTNGLNRQQYASVQAATLAKAARRGYVWTSEELEMADREDLTIREIALALGRSWTAVQKMRQKVRDQAEGRPPRPRNGSGTVKTHGLSGYARGCRCADCRVAKREYDRADGGNAKRQAETLEKAARLGNQWTGPELEVAARNDLSLREIAALLGRSYASVANMRHKMKADPKTISLVGLSSTAAQPDPGSST